MHIMKLTIADELVKVQKYTPSRARTKGEKRARKEKPTIEAVKKNNQRLRAEYIQMLIMLNFKHGYMIILEYDKGSRIQTYQEADRHMMQILKRIKRTNKLFKYIATTERGEVCKGLHHHVIVDSLESARDLVAMWDGYAPEPRQLYQNGNAFKSLAEYLVKQESKEEKPKGCPSYHASRNLVKPCIEYQIIDEPWTDEPEQFKGYEIIPQSLVNGFNEHIGIKYQSYMLKRKIDPSERREYRIRRKQERTRKHNIFNPRAIARGADQARNTLGIIARAAGHGLRAAADYMRAQRQQDQGRR